MFADSLRVTDESRRKISILRKSNWLCDIIRNCRFSENVLFKFSVCQLIVRNFRGLDRQDDSFTKISKVMAFFLFLVCISELSSLWQGNKFQNNFCDISNFEISNQPVDKWNWLVNHFYSVYGFTGLIFRFHPILTVTSHRGLSNVSGIETLWSVAVKDDVCFCYETWLWLLLLIWILRRLLSFCSIILHHHSDNMSISSPCTIRSLGLAFPSLLKVRENTLWNISKSNKDDISGALFIMRISYEFTQTLKVNWVN